MGVRMMPAVEAFNSSNWPDIFLSFWKVRDWGFGHVSRAPGLYR